MLGQGTKLDPEIQRETDEQDKDLLQMLEMWSRGNHLHR